MDYFSQGKRVRIGDSTPTDETMRTLRAVPSLVELADRHVPMENDEMELIAAMEFIIEALHQSKILGKEEVDGVAHYYDMLGDMLEGIEQE